jgi:hypothetical protein
VAQERSRKPLSSVLCNTPDQPDDHLVERLRRSWKKATLEQRPAIEARLTHILTDSVRGEWDALVAARRAFVHLGLPENPALQSLVKESMGRIERGVTNGHFVLASPHTLAVNLGELEEARGKFEAAQLRGDRNVRNLQKDAGRVVEGSVVRIRQPRPKYHPCTVEIETTQRDVRLRVDKHVSIVDFAVEGVVRELRRGARGTTVVAIELDKGVRVVQALAGRRVELIEYSSYSGFKKRQYLLKARERNSWMIFGQAPAKRPVPLPPVDVLALAESLRRGT